MKTFAERLKELRKNRNLTQKQLAVEVELSERGIQNYELGLREPPISIAITLADYFDVSIDYLVGRTEDPKRS